MDYQEELREAIFQAIRELDFQGLRDLAEILGVVIP